MRLYPAHLTSLIVFLAITSTAAHAAPMTDLFTFNSAGTGPVTATILASPTPSSSVANTSFTLSGISATVFGSPQVGDVTFYTAGGAGGGGSTFSGPELFSGPVSAPTFLLGTFPLSGIADLGDGPQQVNGNLVISQSTSSTVPEPLSLGLVGTGIAALAGMLKRRKAELLASAR